MPKSKKKAAREKGAARKVKPETALDKAIRWAPRVITILFICFLSLFALDSFDGSSILMNLLSLLMSMIPGFLLIAVLYFSWNEPRVGAFGFVMVGLMFTFFFHTYETLATFLFLSGPVFLVAVLYFLDYIRRKR